MNDTEMEFDMNGIDFAVKNALRRVMIAEVPVMAIDRVEIMQNKSPVYDELLEERLGLVPMKADPRKFDYRQNDDEKVTHKNCIMFKLKVKGKKKASPDELHSNVYSKDLIYAPLKESYTSDGKDSPRPVDGDILLARLNPGEEISLHAYCFKGVGKTDAKFMPATVTCTCMPVIELTREVKGEEAKRLKKFFPSGIIEVDTIKGEKVARVASSRMKHINRNIFKEEELKDVVSMYLKKDHHIFTIEGTGCYPVRQVVSEGIKVLIEKWETLSDALNAL